MKVLSAVGMSLFVWILRTIHNLHQKLEKEAKNQIYAGDNFIRKSGDAVEIAKLQLFTWEAADKGAEEMHVLATPSQVFSINLLRSREVDC